MGEEGVSGRGSGAGFTGLALGTERRALLLRASGTGRARPVAIAGAQQGR